MIKIERGIPMPDLKRKNVHPKYPFAQMSVGDSFVAQVKQGSNSVNLVNSLRSCALNSADSASMKFSVRVSEDKSFVRVWRIA